jgi:hypothetical protein
MIPRTSLIELSLVELLQQQRGLAAMGKGRGKVRVSFSVTCDSGRATLSFCLPDSPPDYGCLSGNVHLRLQSEEARQIFCLLLMNIKGSIVPTAPRTKLRLRISRLRVTDMEQLLQMLLAARQ